jgi:phospholipid/cholesterol/gamma-HCH transport system substrate-binding protein
MSRSFRDRNPYVIATVSLAVMLILLLLAFSIRPLTERTFPISAEFSDAAGVSAGAPVRVAGVQVGKVASVKADRKNGRVILRLSINDGVKLGPNTRAEVALASLLGAKYVKLSGKVTTPYLRAGAVIPNDRTTTPYDVFQITELGTKRIEETDNEKLNALINQLAAVTDGREASIRELIEGVARLSSVVAARDAELFSLVTRANTISGTLAEKDQTLAALLDQSDGLLRVLAARRDQLARGVREASSAFGQLAGVVAGHTAEIDAILTTLHPTVDILDRRQADLDRTLNWLGEGAFGLALAPSHGPWADVFVRALGADLFALLESLAGGGE